MMFISKRGRRPSGSFFQLPLQNVKPGSVEGCGPLFAPMRILTMSPKEQPTFRVCSCGMFGGEVIFHVYMGCVPPQHYHKSCYFSPDLQRVQLMPLIGQLASTIGVAPNGFRTLFWWPRIIRFAGEMLSSLFRAALHSRDRRFGWLRREPERKQRLFGSPMLRHAQHVDRR